MVSLLSVSTGQIFNLGDTPRLGLLLGAHRGLLVGDLCSIEQRWSGRLGLFRLWTLLLLGALGGVELALWRGLGGGF